MGFLLYLKKDVEYNSWKLEAGSSKLEARRKKGRKVEMWKGLNVEKSQRLKLEGRSER